MKSGAPLQWFIGAMLVFAAALAVCAGLRNNAPAPAAQGILYVVDSTGDGDNAPLNSLNCDDGTGHCTLRAAIEAANNHSGAADTIVFSIPTSDPGYNGTSWTINLGRALPDVSDPVTISGPGADMLVVQRNSSTQFRIFNVTATGTVNLSGLTIAGGFAPSNGTGGGIQNAGTATVNLTNCTITNNSAVQGGGIDNPGSLTIMSSTISGNTSSGSLAGGGIRNDGTLSVTNSTISGNMAPSGDGGGIFNSSTIIANSGTATINSSTIVNNTAHGSGGGIDNFSGTVTVTDSMITDNTAQFGSGGGIYGGVNLTNSTISGNSAPQGGGIHSSTGTVNLMSSTISGNTGSSSQLAGGGIYNSGTLSATNSTISGNMAPSGRGGGILNAASSTPITITSSTITNNTANGSGGGIDNDFGGTVTITDSMITNNTALGSGGGIFGGVNLTNSAISGNSASQGGGIHTSTRTVNLMSSTISGNTASSSQLAGGGIYNSGTLSATNSTISGNMAPSGDGGGILNAAANTAVTITSSTITNNTAHGSGGGIDNQFGSTFSVRSSIVALNTAAGSGPDAFSTFTSSGFNLVGKTDGSTGFTAQTDLRGTIASPLDPKLDPAGLQDNGGPTRTVALLSNSPAIDHGDDSVFGPPPGLPDDQRGYPRKIGAHVDIGAFEYEFGDRLRIISITRSGSNIVITFQAIQGVTYRLQRTPSLSPPNWQSISGVADLTAPSNGPAQITDTTGPISLGKGFYRVDLLP